MLAAQLTKEELLYLAALKGADNMWGIEDPFRDKSDLEIRTALLEMQGALLQKACLEATLDGPFSVSKLYSDLIEECANSSRVYVLSSSQLEAEQAHLRFFVGDNAIVRYQFRETVTLEFVNKDLMKAEMLGLFGDEPGDGDTCSLVTGVARLRRMGSLSKRRFLQELKYCGCEESLALLIADGLQGNSDFCSLLAYERKENQERLIGKLVTLSFSGGSLMVTPENTNVDTVCFTKLNRNRLLSILDEILETGEEVDVV